MAGDAGKVPIRITTSKSKNALKIVGSRENNFQNALKISKQPKKYFSKKQFRLLRRSHFWHLKRLKTKSNDCSVVLIFLAKKSGL